MSNKQNENMEEINQGAFIKKDKYWEDTFDKVMITKSLPNGYRELCGDQVDIVTVMKLKNFISKLLDSELSKLETKNNELWEDGYSFGKYKILEEIPKLKITKEHFGVYHPDTATYWTGKEGHLIYTSEVVAQKVDSYNQAISDVITMITTKIKVYK